MMSNDERGRKSNLVLGKLYIRIHFYPIGLLKLSYYPEVIVCNKTRLLIAFVTKDHATKILSHF